MRVVAYLELIIMARVIIGTITLQNALVSPLVYGHFLRQRYYQSAFTREAVKATNTWIDRRVRKEGNPPMLVAVWDKIQMLIERWTGGVLTTNQQAGAGAGAGGAPRRNP
jgi:transmembrane protein 33